MDTSPPIFWHSNKKCIFSDVPVLTIGPPPPFSIEPRDLDCGAVRLAGKCLNGQEKVQGGVQDVPILGETFQLSKLVQNPNILVQWRKEKECQW